MILITAGIIKKTNKFLIARRKPDIALEGKWEFLTAKLQSNETPEECLKTTLEEAFGIKTIIEDYICSSVYNYKDISISILAYKAKYVSGEVTSKEHDKIMWIDINDFNKYDFTEASLPIISKLVNTNTIRLTENKKDIKLFFAPDLRKGQVLSNKELYKLFKTKPQGGMRRSITTNSLVLISKKIQGDSSIYYNRFKDDNFYHYTGMGQLGDQSLTYSQNKTLSESKINGINIFLFEVYKPKEYTFIGRVELGAEPYQEIQLDAENKNRNVWVFPLKIVDQEN